MIRYSVRFPDELYAAIKALAEREHRSVHAQILHILWQAVNDAPRDARPGPGRRGEGDSRGR